MKNYNDWINEADSASANKPAQHEVNDIVMLKPGEYSGYWSNTASRSDFKASLYRPHETALIVKVVEKIVKNGKWFYLGKIVYGRYYSYGKRSSSGVYSTSYNLLFKDSNCEDKKETEDLLKILEKAKFNVGDDVNVPKGTELKDYDDTKSTTTHDITGKINAISVNITNKSGEIYYIIDAVSSYKAVKESDIEIEIKLSEHSEEEIIKAIENKIKLSLEKKYDGWRVKFPYTIYETKKLLPDHLHFSSKDNCDKFINELSELIEKYTKEQLELFPRKLPKPEDRIYTTSDVWCPTINTNKITQTARHLNIDIKQLLHDKRGTIIGKKFGL
jgi:hypothetical protein